MAFMNDRHAYLGKPRDNVGMSLDQLDDAGIIGSFSNRDTLRRFDYLHKYL